MAQVAGQLVGQRVAVALGGLEAPVVHLPVLADDVGKRDAVVVRRVLAGCRGLCGLCGLFGFRGLAGRGEEHPRDVLRLVVVCHAQQLAGPAEIVFLRQLRAAAEHEVIALRGRPLQHQQSQLLPLAHHQTGHTRHLLCQPLGLFVGRETLRGLEVYVHAHRRALCPAALQRAVGVGQTGVVHLHQTGLQCLVALSDACHVLPLETAVAQFHVFLARKNGAHHLHPVLLVNYIYTHLSLFLR